MKKESVCSSFFCRLPVAEESAETDLLVDLGGNKSGGREGCAPIPSLPLRSFTLLRNGQGRDVTDRPTNKDGQCCKDMPWRQASHDRHRKLVYIIT